MKKLYAALALLLPAALSAQVVTWQPWPQGWIRWDGGAVLALGYTTIQNDAVSVTQRSILNVIGGGCVDNAGTAATDCTFTGGGGGAPTDATYITQTANGSLSAEQALASLSTGIMRVATTTGVITSLTDSSGIAANVSDETGTGALVFGTSPTFTTLTTHTNGSTSGARFKLLEDSDNGSNFMTLGVANSLTGDKTVLFPDTANDTFVAYTSTNLWESGFTQTFNPDGTNAGINVGVNTGVPSALAVGDLVYDDTAITAGLKTKNAQATTITLGGIAASRRTQFVLFEDFTGYVSSAGAVSTGPMRCNVGGTGSGCTNTPAATASTDHPGIWAIINGTTGGSGASISTMQDVILGGGEVYETVVNTNAASGATTNNFTIAAGLCDAQATITCTDGIFFWWDNNVDTFWHIATIKDGTSTATDVASNTAVTYGVSTWHRLRFEVNAAMTSVAFYVDDVALNVSPLTANIPNAGVGDKMFILYKIINGASNVTNNDSAPVDYIYFAKPVTR